MRLTPALYVRQLLAKLHPPLPRTPRESTQLLNLLETSFRRHLDDAHPAPKAREDTTDLSHGSIPLSSVNASNVAHHYLNSVLMHPLLDKQTGSKIGAQTLTGDAAGKFDEALVDGGVTIKLLGDCAKLYVNGIRNGEQVSENQMLGQRVASWLYSASSLLKETFFKTPDLISRIIPVMAADRQETIVWEWLRMVYERDFGGSSPSSSTLSDVKWLKVEDDIVSALMRLSIRRKDLNDAAQQFVEACRYRHESGRALVDASEASGQLSYVPMSSSWKRLAAAVIHFRQSHGIEPDLFDAATRSSLRWTDAPQFSEAILAIYHPKIPSAQILYQKLQNVESAAIFLDSHRTSSKAMRKAMLVSLLDGAQLSLDQGLRQDARFLLDFASKHYPEFLPPSQMRTEQSVESRMKVVRDALQIPILGPYKFDLT